MAPTPDSRKLQLGLSAAGDTLQVTFAFPCNLCPQHYTLTAGLARS
jgi:hypothetical protein